MWGKKSTVFSASGGLDNGVNFPALDAGQADVSQTRSASLPTRVKDAGSVPFSVKVDCGIIGVE
jgi:hypothetical protein